MCTFFQPFLQAVRGSLALEFVSCGLECSVLLPRSQSQLNSKQRHRVADSGIEHLRRSIGIKQYMAFLKLLWVGTVLQMLLEGVLADMASGTNWGDGSLVDDC